MPRIAVWGDEFIGTAAKLNPERFSEEGMHPSEGAPFVSSMGVLDKHLSPSHALPSGGYLTVDAPVI